MCRRLKSKISLQRRVSPMVTTVFKEQTFLRRSGLSRLPSWFMYARSVEAQRRIRHMGLTWVTNAPDINHVCKGCTMYDPAKVLRTLKVSKSMRAKGRLEMSHCGAACKEERNRPSLFFCLFTILEKQGFTRTGPLCVADP
jgi:hypothetical protein